MKVTLDLPNKLIKEAMEITDTNTKVGVIVLALEDLIRKSKIAELKNYKGKIDFDQGFDGHKDLG